MPVRTLVTPVIEDPYAHLGLRPGDVIEDEKPGFRGEWYYLIRRAREKTHLTYLVDADGDVSLSTLPWDTINKPKPRFQIWGEYFFS